MEDADGFIRVRPRRNRRLRNNKTVHATAATKSSVCYETKGVKDIIEQYATAFESTDSVFFSGIYRSIISISFQKPVTAIVIGLGSVHEFSNENSRIQLALLLKLSTILSLNRIWAFDPTFTSADISLLAQYNIIAFSECFSRNSKLPIDRKDHVFTFMPHCVQEVHSEVLLFQAKCEVKTVVFFGNRLLFNNVECPNQVLFKEFVLKINEADRKAVSKLYRAFNDTFFSIVHLLT